MEAADAGSVSFSGLLAFVPPIVPVSHIPPVRRNPSVCATLGRRTESAEGPGMDLAAVVILFKAIGGAPILKQSVFKVRCPCPQPSRLHATVPL